MKWSKPVFCLMGPTACGKTGLAIALTQLFPLDIVNVDSTLVYRGMDIGTAKPTPSEQALAPHRLIDILDPADAYSAGQFCIDARRCIDEIHQAGRFPLLVGGTMLYYQCLQQGVAKLPKVHESLRSEIRDQGLAQGWPALHERLKRIDPETADRLHPNDAQRISRALEVYEASGMPLSHFHHVQHEEASPYNFINILLIPPDRARLHQLIADRFQQMLAAGFLEEAKGLYDRGDLHANLPAMRSVGYRQAWRYFAGEYDFETMQYKTIVTTRQLAKRQLTWLRRWELGICFRAYDPDLLAAVKSTLVDVFRKMQ